MFRDEDYTELLVFFQSLGKSEKDIHKLDVSLNGIDYLYSEDIRFLYKGIQELIY